MAVVGEDVPWPAPPREPGPWNGGPPVAPPGNTPLPPLPGASGTMGGTPATPNPWNQNPVPSVHIPPDRRPPGSPVPGPPPQPPGAPVPAAGSTLKPRAPIALRAVAVIIVLAMVAAGVLLVLKGGRQYPSEWDPKVKDIAEWVAEARELDYEHPVKVNFLTDAEYTEHATAGGDVTDPATAAYYDDQAAQLRALGFISGKVDLASANDTLSDSGTLAYYDPDVEQVFVRGTDMTPALRVTLAHELTHVLQDQHFDLQRMGELPSGEASVLRALAEERRRASRTRTWTSSPTTTARPTRRRARPAARTRPTSSTRRSRRSSPRSSPRLTSSAPSSSTSSTRRAAARPSTGRCRIHRARRRSSTRAPTAPRR
ncbi:MAG: hypothetical protein R2701_02365 [Acidimicrobiales bacterium]